MKNRYIIRMAEQADCSAIMSIKNEAILSSSYVYDEEIEPLEFYIKWLEEKKKGHWPVFVISPTDEPHLVCGYATYGPFRAFAAYRYTVENSLYIDAAYRGQGLGQFLLQHLMQTAAAEGYHLMVAAIDSENQASRQLHEKAGFNYNGLIPESGQKFAQWLDLVFYSYRLDQLRSDRIE